MAKAEKIYRRLDSSWLGRRKQLWRGPDHLLAASVMYGIEKYRRFFFTDIQALIVRRTATATVRSSICGGLGLAALAGLALVFRGGPWSDETGRHVVEWMLGILSGLLLLVALIDLLRGPTAMLLVQTAAGAEPLEAPRRWRAALRLVAQVEPLIAAAQAAPAPTA